MNQISYETAKSAHCVAEAINSPLNSELPTSAEMVIAKALWGYGSIPVSETCEVKCEKALEPYFKYYHQQCRLVAQLNSAVSTVLASHKDLIDIAGELGKSEPAMRRSQILDLLRTRTGSDNTELHLTILHLTARLVTMMRIGNNLTEVLEGRHVEWQDGSLESFLCGYFNPIPVLGHERIKFEKTFHALSLIRIAGLEIQWTDNLVDHLRLVNDDRAVRVFHHATFLRHHDGRLFPPGFVSETIQTLALLFPRYNKKIREWYGTQATQHGLDPAAPSSGHLIADERQIENFKYWHDRLVVLKQMYDESRPSTIGQWYHDRRNGVQWYTFWVAILVLFLTVFFGLVQSIEGALQVYASFQSSHN